MFQREMENIVENFHAQIYSHEALCKRTRLLTTSQIIRRTLQRCQCVGSHHHDVVAGSCKPVGFGRMPVSSTRNFTQKVLVDVSVVLSAIQCSCQVQERVFGSRQELSFVTKTADEESEPKCRRLAGKFHPKFLFVLPMQGAQDSEGSQNVPSPALMVPQPSDAAARQILELAEECAPRVGPVVFQNGPLFQAVQNTYPDRHIICLDICHGINRMRVCPLRGKGIASFRRAIGRHRADLKLFEDIEWEHWETVSHRQQIRSA